MNKFEKAAFEAVSGKLRKGDQVSFDINHRNGTVMVLVSFSVNGKDKVFKKMMALTPELYPDAIRSEHKVYNIV